MPYGAGGECTQERYQEVPGYLFEQAVPATDNVSRAVLTSILCNPAEDFATPILDISTNSHLKVLESAGISICIWQDQARKSL
jgi:hypothetical protein